jgi:hypothetical protein
MMDVPYSDLKLKWDYSVINVPCDTALFEMCAHLLRAERTTVEIGNSYDSKMFGILGNLKRVKHFATTDMWIAPVMMQKILTGAPQLETMKLKGIDMMQWGQLLEFYKDTKIVNSSLTTLHTGLTESAFSTLYYAQWFANLLSKLPNLRDLTLTSGASACEMPWIVWSAIISHPNIQHLKMEGIRMHPISRVGEINEIVSPLKTLEITSRYNQFGEDCCLKIPSIWSFPNLKTPLKNIIRI